MSATQFVYNLLFMVAGLVLAVALAVIINELTNQYLAKLYHSILFLPYFISWIVVAYVVYALGSSGGDDQLLGLLCWACADRGL
jgi:putative aldouronate transport system permease protein